MDAVDSYIPTPERAVDKPFLMPIEDVFGIKGRGTVVTGRIERGIVKIGEEIEIVGFKATRKVVVTGVEMFQKTLDEGQAGDNVGCLLRGIERERRRARPGAGQARHHQAAHQVQRRGVRAVARRRAAATRPFFNGYRPQFYIRTTDVTGTIELHGGVEMVMPGDNVEMEVELITPVAIERACASPFAKAADTVGAGAVTKILE